MVPHSSQFVTNSLCTISLYPLCFFFFFWTVSSRLLSLHCGNSSSLNVCRCHLWLYSCFTSCSAPTLLGHRTNLFQRLFSPSSVPFLRRNQFARREMRNTVKSACFLSQITFGQDKVPRASPLTFSSKENDLITRISTTSYKCLPLLPQTRWPSLGRLLWADSPADDKRTKMVVPVYF